MIPNLSVHGHVGEYGEQRAEVMMNNLMEIMEDMAEVAVEVVAKISDAAS